MEERLQKLMAQSGLGSRRACEQLILAGRVTVNGKVAGLGEKADLERDRILVDGQPLRAAEKLMYVAIYKPRGVLSTVSAPDTRPTVRDQVDLPGHLYPVGRLDVDSEGLMLLTNDGALANRLTHPRYEHEKEYRVLVASRPDDEQLSTWRRGVVLEEGYKTQAAEVRIEQPFGKGAWLRVILKEGRKRQIRETGSKLGLPVVKIIRVRIGSLTLGSLQPGQWRLLTDAEVQDLKQPAGSRGHVDSRQGRSPRKQADPAHRKKVVAVGRQRARSRPDSTRSNAIDDRSAQARKRSADRPTDGGEAQHRPGEHSHKSSQSKTRKPASRSTGRTGSSRWPKRPGARNSRPGSTRPRKPSSSKKRSSR